MRNAFKVDVPIRLARLGGGPDNPEAGALFFSTTKQTLDVFDGTQWQGMASQAYVDDAATIPDAIDHTTTNLELNRFYIIDLSDATGDVTFTFPDLGEGDQFKCHVRGNATNGHKASFKTTSLQSLYYRGQLYTTLTLKVVDSWVGGVWDDNDSVIAVYDASSINMASLLIYTSDPDYVTDKGSAAADGDIYYNSTDDVIRYYSDGAWSSLLDNDSSQLLENKTLKHLTQTSEEDSTSTGANATITPTSIQVNLTNASLTSVDGFVPNTTKVIVVTNATGSDITLNNETGTSENQIITGTGSSIVFKNTASLYLVYDPHVTKWRVVGAVSGGDSGGGGVAINTSVEYISGELTVGNVGDLGQVRAGHELEALSFPSGADVSWYNLEGVADGNTTNAHNFTNVGSITFDGTGILGDTNGCANLTDSGMQGLLSTDSFFNPADTDWALGGWFKATDWNVTGPETLLCQWNGAANGSFRVQIAAGLLSLYYTTDGSTSLLLGSTDVSGLSGWHHLVVMHTASSSLFEVYIDGDLSIYANLTGALYSPASPTFELGQCGYFTNWFNGYIDEFFFINGTSLTDDQISKIVATKFEHNRGVSPSEQEWQAVVFADDQSTPHHDGYVVDMTTNSLYALFFDLPASAQVSLILQSHNTFGLSVPSVSKELASTAAEIDALLPIAHGLQSGVIPTLELLVEETADSGEYSLHDPSTYFKSSGTQIVATTTTLASGLGIGTARCILRWSTGGKASVAQHQIWDTKVVTTNSAVLVNEKILANPTGRLDLTLPLTPSIGSVVKFIDFDGTWSATDFVRLLPSGSDTIMGDTLLDLDVPNDSVELVYNGTGDWRISGW